MPTLTMRPYQGEADLEDIADLINTCAKFDNLLDQGVSVAELRSVFNTPSCDQARDICLWEDTDGKLIAYGHLWITEPSETIDGYLAFQVYPHLRGNNVETQIIRWAQQRMGEVRQARGFPVKLRCGARDSQSYRQAILESHGFKCDRYFLTMKRSLAQPIPQPQFPPGFTLRFMNGEQDAEAWVELHNQSFIDHWNYHPLTVETLKHWLSEPYYRADLDLIATAADGTFVACCYCQINPEDNARSERNEGYIDIVATRRGFRRLGLGRALLLAGMQQLKTAGVDTVRLGVDADNPNGALQLYESVGFTKVFSRIAYVKDV